jgi:hypothetical protein
MGRSAPVIGLIAQAVPGTGAADKVTADLSGNPAVVIIALLLIVGALLCAFKTTRKLGVGMIGGGALFGLLVGGLAQSIAAYVISLGKAG